jgi:predicted RNA polymerase sigma factor
MPESARRRPVLRRAVLEAIYAAYDAGWDDVGGTDPHRRGLTDEALRLAHLLSGAGREDERREAYTRALGLCEDPHAHEFLIARRRTLEAPRP